MHDAIRPLMLTPPPSFVAARNEAAKALRRDGDRDLAAAISKLRRPSWTDHALNVVADAQPDLVARFLDAAAATRGAQQGVLDGDTGPSLADAMRALRAAQAPLVDAATEVLDQVGRKPDPAAVAERLTGIAASSTSAEQLQQAILGVVADDEDPTRSWFADTATSTAPTSTTTTRRNTARARADSRPSSDGDASVERRLRAELEAAQEAHRDAKRAARTADKATAAADKALARARAAAETAAADLAAARAAAEQADAALGAADADADAAHRDRDLAQSHLEDAAAAVDAAQHALDQVD